jgi:hypothetical protein
MGREVLRQFAQGCKPRAAELVWLSLEEPQEPVSLNAYLADIERKGGKKGGQPSKEAVACDAKEIAKAGAKARCKNRKKN